jgi:hypothetical protein
MEMVGFNFSEAQKITDLMIEYQSQLKFKEAADLYKKVISEIDNQEFTRENESEWIEILLADETRAILFAESF